MLSIKNRLRQIGPGGIRALTDLAGVEPLEVFRFQLDRQLVSEESATRIEGWLVDLEFIMAAADGARAQGVPFSVNLRDVPNLRKLIAFARKQPAELEIQQAAECIAQNLVSNLFGDPK